MQYRKSFHLNNTLCPSCHNPLLFNAGDFFKPGRLRGVVQSFMRTMVLRGFSLLHFAQTWQCCLKLIIILKPKQKSEIVDIRASGAEKEIVPETDVIPDKPQRKQGKKVETLFQALYLAETEKAIIQ